MRHREQRDRAGEDYDYTVAGGAYDGGYRKRRCDEKNVNIVKGKAFDNGGDGGFYYESEKQVVSRDTADKIKDMMYLAVAQGTGRTAYDKKLKICGKKRAVRRRVGRKTVLLWFTAGLWDFSRMKNRNMQWRCSSKTDRAVRRQERYFWI
ncbi:MAG: hypothetical protein L6V93_15515 [Clostridiales bacterium]|nr:MAG: hypothetical protein L6V93_15515 [Clostridiales bacterium]